MLSVLSSVILQGCKEEWSLFPFNGDMLVQLGDESGIWDENRQWQQVGLPRQPYYVELALSLITWKNTGSLSYLNYNDFFGLTPDSSVIGKLESLYESLIVCFNNFPPTDDNGELKSNWKSFFGNLDTRSVATLLRIRTTIGSVDLLPPSRKTLLDSFELPHCNKPKVKLTAGAKALSKHAHRASDGFWGEMNGGEDIKNQRAVNMINKIMDNAVWINLHRLPHDLFILEIRIEDGYGARWEVDGSKFRGFLEPQMEDGHQKGWKH